MRRDFRRTVAWRRGAGLDFRGTFRGMFTAGCWRVWLAILAGALSPGVAQGAATPTKLFFTQASGTTSLDALKSANLDGSSVATLADNSDDFQQPRGVAVDSANGYVFVADASAVGAGIVRYNLDGTGRTVVVSPIATVLFNDVAVAGSKIYFVQGSATSSLDALKSANLDGSGLTTLASDSSSFLQPNGVAVDLAGGYIYVADGGTTGSAGIVRFNLDGSNRTVLVAATASAIYNDIAVAGSKIYFTQASLTTSLDALKSANLDGSSVATLASDSLNFGQPGGLAVDTVNSHIYLADAAVPSTGRGLLRFNLDGSNRTEIVAPTTSAQYADVAIQYVTPPPAAPSTPDLAASSDTGASSTDNVTADNTPTFVGTAEAASTVTLISSVQGTVGSTTADGSGNWTITASSLASGTHTITATAANSGGTSSPSSGLAVTIDVTAPSAPVFGGITTDTGALSNDQVTSDTTLQISGTAEAGATVTVTLVGTGTVGSATANGGGSWTFDFTGTVLGEGEHTFTATATDAAGNTSGASGAFDVTVITTPPSVSIGSPSVSETATGGGSVTYNVQYSDGTTITLAEGDVTLNSTGSATATVGVSGVGTNRTVTLSGVSGVGTLGISIGAGTATDLAGNTSAAAGPSATFSVLGLDYGDAPTAAQSGFSASYPVTLGADGARHRVPGGGAVLYLGAVGPDGEGDGQPEASALGDDNVGDDEDGVTLPSAFPGGKTVDVTVAVVGDGRLSVWIDWNRDGDWEDSGEDVVLDEVLTSAGSPHTLQIAVPSNVGTGGTFARFRYATQAGLGPTGEALDGEVEDHQVALEANTDPVAGNDVMQTLENEVAVVHELKLLVNDTDVDGDDLAVGSVDAGSVAGGTVSYLGGQVTYVPPAGFSGVDSFGYTVSDGRGGSATGTVTVTVRERDAQGDLMASITPVAGGFRIRFAGIPGVAYAIQWADGATGPWSLLATSITATGLGIVEFDDTTAPTPNARFYRVISAAID